MGVSIFENGSGGRLNLRGPEPFSVGNAGATGDGQTDDYRAILNASTRQGSVGAIFFPPGTYRVGTSLTINCQVVFALGATLKPDSGVMVTLAGPVTTAPGESIIAAGTLGTVAITGPTNGSGALDVRTFGAVGDGVADDTAAIQRAVTAMTAGDSLVFPAGFTFLVSANITKTGVDDLCFIAEGATIYTTDMSLTGVFTLTSCDRVTWRGGYFLGTEDNAYFQANSPSQERSFIYLDTCLRASVLDVSGKNKRRLLTARLCDYLTVDNYKFEGFFQNLSLGRVSNFNHHPSVTIRACDYAHISRGNANNCSSILLGQLSSEHVTVSQMSGTDLHDNGAYCSSGFYWTFSDVTVKWCAGNAVQTRGPNMTVNNVVGHNLTLDYVVDMSGLGLSQDAFGADADGYNLVASNIVGYDCVGLVNIAVNTYYPRDIRVSNVSGYMMTGTGDKTPPVEVSAVRGVLVSGVQIRTIAADIGVVVTGQNAGNPCVGVVVSDVSVSDVNGSSASTRGGIRLAFCNSVDVHGCVFSDIASNIGVRLLTCAGGVVYGNVFEGQQVVRIPTAETNTGIHVFGNRGATLNVDGTANVIGDNDATVTGYPATSTTPLRIGQLTFSGGEAFIATGVASSADWQQITP